MFYMIGGIIGLLFLVALFTFIFGRQGREKETTFPDKECCGAHEVCEKGLKKIATSIVYYNDEELDVYKRRPADSYTDDELDIFRDVLYTLRRKEIDDWLVSIEKREILFPEQLKPELLELLR